MTTAPGGRHQASWLAAAVVVLLYGIPAVTVDVARTSGGVWSDEATYLLMGHSLASDGDLEYRREDLERTLAEFPEGPSGIFLKRGTDVTGIGLSAAPPFIVFRGVPDPATDRLYYGKSFIYPLAAAPFVFLFGTNGFLVLNALLMGAAVLAGCVFLRARSSPAVAVILGTAFVLATVVPVYAVWTQPEVFNFALGMLAYFCWLYKFVAPEPAGARSAWLRGPASDIAAGALIGLVTFSKVTNALLMVPIGLWWLWRRDWRRVVATSLAWAAVTAGLFGANVAVTGEWNYQGSNWENGRRTCYADSGYYPLQEPGRGLEECAERGRSEALLDVIFDADVFWPTLRANLVYFVTGRNSGLVAYFFPVVFGVLALVLARGRREPWQWFVVGGLVLQVLLLVISLPNTYFGGGGSVGNRYFMGVYGICLFLIPPIRTRSAAVVPWVVGAVFMTPLVLSPYDTSRFPARHSKVAPLRWLPVELTNVLDLPLNNEHDRVRQWFGDNPGVGDLGFQVFFLDDYAYGRESETDKSFWVQGESRAEILVRTTVPVRYLRLGLSSGPQDTDVEVRVGGRSWMVRVEAGRPHELVIALPPGFPYKHARPDDAPDATYVWVVSIASSAGFVPAEVEPGSADTRFLGVRVKPVIAVH